jgi:hypothetical protein
VAKVQTRRTISINRALHDRASSDAIQLEIPLSQLTEMALEMLLGFSDEEITRRYKARITPATGRRA